MRRLRSCGGGGVNVLRGALVPVEDVYELNLENIVDLDDAADDYWVHTVLQEYRGAVRAG